MESDYVLQFSSLRFNFKYVGDCNRQIHRHFAFSAIYIIHVNRNRHFNNSVVLSHLISCYICSRLLWLHDRHHRKAIEKYYTVTIDICYGVFSCKENPLLCNVSDSCKSYVGVSNSLSLFEEIQKIKEGNIYI